MQFYLGPPGRLFALPIIERDSEVPATADAPSGIFTSLKGAKSQDRIGVYRRAWELPFKYLAREDFRLLDAMRRGHLGSPLRLVDPQWPNLLNAQLATGGTEDRSVVGFSASAGGRRFVRPTSIPLDLLSVGAIEWTSPGAQDDLSIGGREASELRLPAPPAGSSVAVAGRIIRSDAPAATSVLVGVDSWTAAGVRATTLSTARTVTGLWADVEAALTLPAGAVEWSPVLRSPSGSGAAFYLAGLRAAWGTTAPPADEGGGSAEVLITDLPLTYPSQDEFTFTLKLEEC